MALSKITNDGIDNITIDSSGNVGIGTTSPATATGGGIDIERAGGASVRIDDTTNSVTGELQVYSSGMNLATTTNHNMLFSTNNSEHMRIDSSGNLLVGATSQGGTEKMRIFSSSSTSLLIAGNASPHYAVIFRNSSNGVVGFIYTDASSTTYSTTSDYRLKENDVDMTGAIERVKQLQPKRFNFISDPDDTTVDGFMAHEVQTVVPEAITGTHNEVDDEGNPVYQGIDQSKLVPLLTGALQEAIAKIETLEAKVTALENA